MTEKDLDIAIEKCERIMEFDTRTLQNPESEDGWIFNKVYDLLKFLRECQFDTDAKGDMNDLISRQAAITEFSRCELTPDGGIDANYAIDFLKQMPPVDAVPVVRCKDCKHWRIFVRSPFQDEVFKSGKLWKYCINVNAMTPEDGYCHLAESGVRKDGEQNEE